MNTIIAIISTLNEDSKLEFTLWLKRKNRRGDTKNLKLFKYLVMNNTEHLDVKLYGKPSKNAFHALCKRLQDSLLDFIASKSLTSETSEELDILKLIIVGRIFLEQQNYKLGFRTLVKAEKLAIFIDHYSLLNEIYHRKYNTYIFDSDVNISELFEKANRNMQSFQKDFTLNMAYSEIKQRMKNTDSIGEIDTIIETIFEKYRVTIDASLSYKSLYQLMNVTSISAKLQRNYYAITPFILKAYAVVNSKHSIAHKHLYYHIGILHIMAMMHFRNKNFKASMDFVNQMEHQMLENNKKYYKRYFSELVMLKAVNYNYTGNFKGAITLLEGYSNSLDNKLILLMCLFQQNRFEDAYALFKKMNHSDVWYEKKAGWIWVLKKSIIEILILIELDKLDLVLLRVQGFKKKFTKRLKDIGETRVLTFVKLMTKYYNEPKQVTSLAFREEVQSSFEWKENAEEDIYVMSFYAWLKAKMENQDLYATTLQLVQGFA